MMNGSDCFFICICQDLDQFKSSLLPRTLVNAIQNTK